MIRALGRNAQLSIHVKDSKMAAHVQQIPVTSNDPSPASRRSGLQNPSRRVTYGNYSGDCCYVAEMKKLQNRDMGLFAIYSSAPNSGQTNVPRYLQNNLFSNILNQPGFWSNPEKAIIEAFRETKAEILTKEKMASVKESYRALTAMVIDGRQLLVANVGDSKAVLCRAGTAVQLSIDSTCYTRITNPPWLDIQDDLHEIAKEEGMGSREELIDWATEFLILASDGVWKTMGNEEAVDLVKEVMDPDTAAKLLVDRAAEKGISSENLSCIVIRFE